MALRSLSTGKQYKNVYTILEKVKKGEIQTHYKDRDGLFGKLNFYKKPDLVKPHLHYLDENRLDNITNAYFNDTSNLSSFWNKFSTSADFKKKIPDDKKPDQGKFTSKMRDNYQKFPKHIVKDIFKMYYNKIERLDFEERTDANYSKYKFLEKSNNPIGKIMSQGSNLKSAIFARNILAYYIARLTMLEFVDPQAAQDLKKSMDGGSEFDQSGIDNILKDMCDSTQAKNMLQEAMDQATQTCKQMDEVMPDDVQERMFEQSENNGEAAKLNAGYLNTVAARLARVNMSLGSLKDKIAKLLDKSTSFFSARKETIYENLFDSDNIAALDDFELLHPKLRKLFAEDINIKDTKYKGKIDVYIDISGSMGDRCGVQDANGNSISRLDFAKSFVAKLSQIDMLNNVYLFDNRVKKYKSDIISVSMIDCGGGTTIDAAVNSIERNKVNALVITDAEDHCTVYSDKAFFIGTLGARFTSFNSNVIKQYSERGQVVIFDGHRILNVDTRGRVTH